ncbi:MAG: DUF433 domain-containing protein [Candidatus Methylumidiphilus sp.]
MPFNYQPYFVTDPKVCGGEPVIAGTRVTLRTVLACVADGMSAEEIMADFPSLSREAVTATLAFAAVSAEEDRPIRYPTISPQYY